MAGQIEQYPWSFGPEVENGVREAIRLRYRLLPYLYAAFLHAAETGAPVQRPLLFDYQYDDRTRNLDDQYLLGADLLVAPVLHPGASQRSVYLPAGGWYAWHSGEFFADPGSISVATPLGSIPVFARAGAVIPMWPEAPPSTLGYQPKTIELRVFVPAADGVFTSFWQEDDGESTAAQLADQRLRSTVAVRRRGATISLSGTVSGAGFPQFRRTSLRIRIVGADPTSVTADGDEIPLGGTRAGDESADARWFELPNAGAAFEVSFEV